MAFLPSIRWYRWAGKLLLFQLLVFASPRCRAALPTNGLCRPGDGTTKSFQSRDDKNVLDIMGSRAGSEAADHSRGLKVKGVEPSTLQSRKENPRFAWDKLKKCWVLSIGPHEDLSVESLQRAWDFEPSECLTFRRGKPDRWGHYAGTPGFCGVLEFILFMTPGLNLLVHSWAGMSPCAVCGLARSQHPLKNRKEASQAFFTAYAHRDIELCVRLVRGGVDCMPGGKNWCLLAFIIGNYCKDAYKEIPGYGKDACYKHLEEPTPKFEGWFFTKVPFL